MNILWHLLNKLVGLNSLYLSFSPSLCQPSGRPHLHSCRNYYDFSCSKLSNNYTVWVS